MNAATNAQRTVIPVVVPGAPRHTATTGLVASSSSSSSSSKHHPYPYPVAAGAGEVTHPTAKNKAEHHTLCPPADTSLGGTVHCLAVSPKDPDLRVVPASNNNKKTTTMKGGDANSSSSDRRRRALVVMYRGSVVARLERHREQVEALAFSEDGRWLASGDAGGVVAVWRVDPRPAASPHTSVSFAYQLPLGGASPSPSSSILALAFTSAHLVVSHAHLSVYPIPTATATATREQQQQQNEEEEDAREVVHHAPLPWSDLRATALAWAGALGNHIVACRRDAVCLYTLPGLELVASWTESSSKRRRIAGVAVSESGIIAVATGHTVQLLRYTNHVLVPAALLSDHASDVYSVAFSAANPSVLASGSADMTVRVWEVLDGRGAAARCTRLISNTRAGVRCVNLSGPPDRCCSQRLTFATSKAAIFQVQLQLTDDSPRTPPSDSSSSCPSPCPSLDWASDIAGEVEEEEEDQAEHRAPPLPPPGAAANQQPVDEDDDDDVVFLGTRSSDSGERPEAGRPPSSATQLRQRQRDTDEPCSAPRRRRLGEGASTALFVPIRPGPQVAVVSPRPRPLPLPLPEEPPQLVGQWRAGATGMPTAAAATAVAAAPALSRRYFHASPQSVGVGGPVFQPPAGQLRTGLLLAALQAVPAECGVMALHSRLRHQLLGKSEAASAAALLTVSHKGFTESPMHQLSEALVRQDRALVEKWRPLVELAMQGLQQCEQCTPGIRPLLRAGQRLPSGYTVGDSLTFPGFAPLFRAKPDGLLPFCESARSARLPTVFRIQAPSARVPRNMDAHSDAFLAPGTVLRVVSVDVRTGVVDLQEVVTESP